MAELTNYSETEVQIVHNVKLAKCAELAAAGRSRPFSQRAFVAQG